MSSTVESSLEVQEEIPGPFKGLGQSKLLTLVRAQEAEVAGQGKKTELKV